MFISAIYGDLLLQDGLDDCSLRMRFCTDVPSSQHSYVPSTIGSFEDPGSGGLTHFVFSCVLSSDTSILQ
jgi:hypothetical protein